MNPEDEKIQCRRRQNLPNPQEISLNFVTFVWERKGKVVCVSKNQSTKEYTESGSKTPCILNNGTVMSGRFHMLAALP
jgi:hypothetical protein